MRAKRLRLGRIAQIPLYVDPSWLMILAGMTWILVESYLPSAFEASQAAYWLYSLATVLLFFATVLLHEVGHALVARAQGAQVRQITLLFFGGVAEMESAPTRARDELVSALVGPAVTIAIGLFFGQVHALTQLAHPPIAASARLLEVANLALGLFNLLPGLPLDGGRILRAALWGIVRDPHRAARWAARVGQGLGVVIMCMGVLLAVRTNLYGGALAAFVGLSLHQSARAAYSRVSVQRALQGYTVSDLMQPSAAMLAPWNTLDRLPMDMLMGDSSGYLVGEDGSVVGLVNLRRVRRVPRNAWGHTRLDSILTRHSEMEMLSPEMPLELALQRMASSDMAQLPVMADGALQGIVSRQRITMLIEMRAGAGPER